MFSVMINSLLVKFCAICNGRQRYSLHRKVCINPTFGVKLVPQHIPDGGISLVSIICLFVYLGFYVAFNTVQVISRRVVGRAEETST